MWQWFFQINLLYGFIIKVEHKLLCKYCGNTLFEFLFDDGMGYKLSGTAVIVQ